MLLVGETSEPHANLSVEADSLWIRTLRAQEHSKGTPKNQEVVEIWDVLIGKDGTLAGFIAEWKVQPISPMECLDDMTERIESIFSKLVAART